MKYEYCQIIQTENGLELCRSNRNPPEMIFSKFHPIDMNHLTEWKATVEKIPIQKEDESAIKIFLVENNNNNSFIKEGIDIDPALIEVYRNCCGKFYVVNDGCYAIDCARLKKQVPEQAEETQDELWEKALFGLTVTQLKSKFIITRIKKQ